MTNPLTNKTKHITIFNIKKIKIYIPKAFHIIPLAKGLLQGYVCGPLLFFVKKHDAYIFY